MPLQRLHPPARTGLAPFAAAAATGVIAESRYASYRKIFARADLSRTLLWTLREALCYSKRRCPPLAGSPPLP